MGQTFTTEAKYCVWDSRAIEEESILGGIGRSTFSISFWILLVYSELKSTVGSDSISPPVYKLKNIYSGNAIVCLLKEFSHKILTSKTLWKYQQVLIVQGQEDFEN